MELNRCTNPLVPGSNTFFLFFLLSSLCCALFLNRNVQCLRYIFHFIFNIKTLKLHEINFPVVIFFQLGVHTLLDQLIQ